MAKARPNSVLRRVIGAALINFALVVSIPTLANALPTSPNSSMASQLPSEVADFRSSMTAQLDDYFMEYGDRLSDSERKQIVALRRQVDRELQLLQARTRVTARLEAQKASVVRRSAAAHAAARAFDSTYIRAIAGLEKVQPILQSKLSLFEAFGAKSDLDEQLSQFDELGRRIHEVAGK